MCENVDIINQSKQLLKWLQRYFNNFNLIYKTSEKGLECKCRPKKPWTFPNKNVMKPDLRIFNFLLPNGPYTGTEKFIKNLNDPLPLDIQLMSGYD